jgi:acyl carrier protein
LVTRLQGLSPEQRHRELEELVCNNAATVLGHSTSDIDAERPFQDLGFDSLTAVELRNRLKTATGLTLTPTVIFDFATPRALAGHLETQLADAGGGGSADRMARVNDVARELQTLIDQPDWDPEDKKRLTARLQALLTALGTAAPDPMPVDDPFDDDINSATNSQLFAILDEEVGP